MSSYTPFETEILTMMKEMKTDISELKSDAKEMKTQLGLLEGDIEYLEIEGRAEGATTRALLLEYIKPKKISTL